MDTSSRIVRNCRCYFICDTGGWVTYRLHASPNYTFRMPSEEWYAHGN